MKKIIKEYNIQTGEETIIERDETKEEKAERENYEFLLNERLDKVESERKTKAAARQALLNKLGITEEEARLLLGGN